MDNHLVEDEGADDGRAARPEPSGQRARPAVVHHGCAAREEPGVGAGGELEDVRLRVPVAVVSRRRRRGRANENQ